MLVAINSAFQIIAFGALGWLYLQLLPGWLGLDQVHGGLSIGTIALALVYIALALRRHYYPVDAL